jgi:hypothetical protein
MQSRRIEITLNENDWEAYLMAAQSRAAIYSTSGPQQLLKWLPAAFMLALGAWVVIAASTGGAFRPPLFALIAVFAFTGLLRLVSRTQTKPADDGVFLGPAVIELDPTGMRLHRPHYSSHVAWTPACSVTSTSMHVFVWIDIFTAQVIPMRDLPAGLSASAIEAEVRQFIAQRTSAPDAGPVASLPADFAAPETPPAAVASPEPSPSILDELIQLGRLHLLLDPRPRLLQGRDSTIALLGLTALVLMISFQRATHSSAEFMWYALPSVAWFACIGLLVAWAFSRAARPAIPFRRSLVLVTGFSVFAALALGIGQWFGKAGEIAALFILAGEAFIFFSRGLTAVTGKPQRRAFMAGAATLIACALLNAHYFFSPSFWYEPEAEFGATDEDAPRLEREQLIFDQALIVEQSVQALRRAESPATQFFFLGFAGYGEQRVFAEEIDVAARRVHERFGTDTRSLRLVNDRRDPEKFPWASSSALSSSLRGMGRVMDVENDVLFLALSSHGSEEGYISVNDGQPFTRDLYALDLARMLRESGIRWKVIVVSACHAGTFIEPLKDENTIVITAAAADRTSFGCSDDRDLTYFGEAFYRDALPDSANLRAAFENARAAIGKREGTEGITRSNPQAYFGAAIERKLAELEEAVVAAR